MSCLFNYSLYRFARNVGYCHETAERYANLWDGNVPPNVVLFPDQTAMSTEEFIRSFCELLEVADVTLFQREFNGFCYKFCSSEEEAQWNLVGEVLHELSFICVGDNYSHRELVESYELTY